MDNSIPNIRENKALTEEYVKEIERRGKQEASELSTGENPQGLLDKLMEIQGNVRLSNGSIYWKEEEKKEKLEHLVNNIIIKEYGEIISSMNVDLDIKLVGGDNDMDDIRDDMSVTPEEMDAPEEEDVEDNTNYEDDEDFEDNTSEEVEDNTNYEDDEDFDDNTVVEEETDEHIIDEVSKRQLINNITQGSAKNTHRLIHMYKSEIDEIDPNLFEIMDKLIKNNEANEWLMFDPESSLEGTGQLIKDNMNGYSDIEFPDDSDGDCDEDCDIDNDDFSSLLEDENKPENPILYARAIDIVVLLHESVKSLYEYLGAGGIPEEEDLARYVLNFTDNLDNEFIDLKYGVYLRRDLLDFVNENESILNISNGFEYVWGRLVELEAEQFIKLFRSIFIESHKKDIITVDVRSGEEYINIVGTPRVIIDEVINIISDELIRYEQELAEYESALNEWEEYEKFMEDNPDYTEEEEDSFGEEQIEEDSFENMSQRDIKSEIDRIIDEEDISNPNIKERLDELSDMLS